MIAELFDEYRSRKASVAPVDAAMVEYGKILLLAKFVGGEIITEKMRGGSIRYSGIRLYGTELEVGDYIIAGPQNKPVPMKKEQFEKLFQPKVV